MKKTLLVLFVLLISHRCFATTVKLCGVDWPPFTNSHHGTLTHGLSIDVYSEAFRRLGMKIDVKSMPWQRCMKLVKHGSMDALIDNTHSDDFIHGPTPTAFYPLAIYVRSDAKQSKFSWAAMENKNVAMVKGYDYTEKIASFKLWNKLYAQSESILVKMLKAKRFDYILLDPFAAKNLEITHDVKLKMLTPVIDTAELYLVFNHDKSVLMNKFDAKIIEMINDGTMNRLYLNYLPTSYTDFVKMVTK